MMKETVFLCDQCRREIDLNKEDLYTFKMGVLSTRGASVYVGPPTDKQFGDPDKNFLREREFCSISCAIKFYDLKDIEIPSDESTRWQRMQQSTRWKRMQHCAKQIGLNCDRAPHDFVLNDDDWKKIAAVK